MAGAQLQPHVPKRCLQLLPPRGQRSTPQMRGQRICLLPMWCLMPVLLPLLLLLLYLHVLLPVMVLMRGLLLMIPLFLSLIPSSMMLLLPPLLLPLFLLWLPPMLLLLLPLSLMPLALSLLPWTFLVFLFLRLAPLMLLMLRLPPLRWGRRRQSFVAAPATVGPVPPPHAWTTVGARTASARRRHRGRSGRQRTLHHQPPEARRQVCPQRSQQCPSCREMRRRIRMRRDEPHTRSRRRLPSRCCGGDGPHASRLGDRR